MLNDGYEYQGRRYKSLSAIARAITGTRWNGPAFFILQQEREEGANSQGPLRHLHASRPDERLDLEFNSLDAQREAVLSYILSQKHEGWGTRPDGEGVRPSATSARICAGECR